jgi:GT2 family glycosyltransferase
MNEPIGKKKLSVIIPTYRRIDLLRKCLERLSADYQGLDQNVYEVIVTDDCPNQSAQTALQTDFFWVRWLKGPGRGPSANRNHGIRNAQADFMVLTDDDCLPSDHWLKAFWQAHLLQPAVFFEGKTMADRPQIRYDEESPLNLEGGLGWSCNVAFPNKIFVEVGGFDEEFPYPAMEDVDFHLRVSQRFPVQFVEDAVIVHPWRRIDPWPRMRMQYASRIYFYRKHQQQLGVYYRWNMLKSWVVTCTLGGIQLLRYGGRGFSAYLAQCVLRFKLIFGS